jgi:hypothetical protein
MLWLSTDMKVIRLGFPLAPAERLHETRGHFRTTAAITIPAVREKLIEPVLGDKGGRRLQVGVLTPGGWFEPMEEQPKQLSRYQYIYLPGFGVFKNSGGSKKKLQALSIPLDAVVSVSLGQMGAPAFRSSFADQGSLIDFRVRFQASASMTLSLECGNSISLVLDTAADLTTWITAFIQGNLVDQAALPW